MKSISTWKLIAQSLQQDVPVMLLYVLESIGSSPGRQGFCMAVNANDEMVGSIGGGIMEHKFVEMVKERLRKEAYDKQEIRKQYHDKIAAKNQSGMICSGEQTIFLYPVKQTDTATVQNIISSLEQNKNGTLSVFPAGITFSHSVPLTDFHFVMRSYDDWEYVEKTGYKNHLSIIGGGHCALAFSKLMRSMDFYIRLYDERKDLKTVIENDFVHETHFINGYAELNQLIQSGDNHYVVIMTLGYRSDDLAIRALWNKEFKYLAVLGSKAKFAKMLDEYRREGIREGWLQQLRSPAGLQIKSQTPDEIAVSIAAEIIQVKNRFF